jgi:hypothetical protein
MTFVNNYWIWILSIVPPNMSVSARTSVSSRAPTSARASYPHHIVEHLRAASSRGCSIVKKMDYAVWRKKNTVVKRTSDGLGSKNTFCRMKYRLSFLSSIAGVLRHRGKTPWWKPCRHSRLVPLTHWSQGHFEVGWCSKPGWTGIAVKLQMSPWNGGGVAAKPQG